ncbi:hypothetical protein SCUCBS95973_009475 [Sporothrix curviconia]|uniref:FAD-binding domain-containing protein n=1 Tax=Sporothrix curviconia TaxID=1260050 RepID=A0ABP0CY05_9PEZI
MPLSILIVGCSIAGPALASFLQLAPFADDGRPRITVVERSPAVRPQGQNVDIRGIGVSLLDRLGIAAAVKASTTGEAGVQWVSADNRVWCEFGSASDSKTQRHNPTSDIEILRGRMAQILYRRSLNITDENAVEYVFDDYLDDIRQDDDKVTVHFSKSGEHRTFDLVVGADGLQSTTRSMAWGTAKEADVVHPLGMYAAFFSMPRDESQGDNAYRRSFHTHGRRMMSIRPDQQNGRSTALLTVMGEGKDGRSSSRFRAAAERGATVASQKDLLQKTFADAGWQQTSRILREMQATDDFYFSMVAQVRMPCWHKGRVVLLGDAAHCASHLSGMGTTLAMLGAYSLAGALAAHPHDVETALTAYEDAVRPHVSKAQKLMTGIMRIFMPETAWGVWLVDTTIRFLVWTRVFVLLMRFKGPDTEPDALPEYGLAQPPKYKE